MPDKDHRREDGQRCRAGKGLSAFKLKLIRANARTRLRGQRFGGGGVSDAPPLPQPPCFQGSSRLTLWGTEKAVLWLSQGNVSSQG